MSRERACDKEGLNMTKNISRFAVEGGNGGVAPSVDIWLREAKTDSSASGCGMYLIHNGVVRQTARAKVRLGRENGKTRDRSAVFL